MSPDDLVERFEFFDEWQERYAYIIDLGRKLEPMDAALKTEQSKVQGCLSQVWMVCQPRPDGTLHFVADSDSAIVRGLIYLLLALYSDRTPADMLTVDIDSVFGRIGLSQHLSPNRRNGFYSMVGRIRGEAESRA